MTSMSRMLSVAATVTVICGGTALVVHGDEPHHQLPAPADGKSKVVGLCDGETSVTVPGVAPGERMDAGTARKVADELMNKYDQKLQVAHGGTEHTQRETRVWEAELKRVIDEGYRLFHSNELGTNGISCDMCHPDANITHPETYPKFQVQLKKVALLRDMINWCIENPLEGPKLADGDDKMKAIEAYILSTRKGVALEPGKH
ncbi:MAG TPA: cytochrome C [Candidatus Kryptonia bacterium]|nr:cytochrome C [Candidatus Kryptonia bacterium]